MFVREAGEGDVSFVFVHGLGESGLCFEALMDHPGLLPWRRIVLDLPGYGRSVWRRPVGTLGDAASQLAGWILERRPGRVVLVGHSMGGVIALLLAERYPSLVAALVDVDGNKSLGDCSFSGPAARSSLDAFVGGGFDDLRDTVFEQGKTARAQRGYYASLRMCDPLVFHGHATELVELSRGERLAARLAALPIPKLYVAGQPGGACPRSVELLNAHGVPWIGIEPAGHWPFIDQPDAFVDVLIRIAEAV